MSTQQINVIRKWFPHLPTTRAQLYLRFIMISYLVILMLLLAFVHPIRKSINISSLALQFGSSALLFWESVTQKHGFDLVDKELQLQNLGMFPLSRPEWIVGRIGSLFSFIVFFGAVLMIALQVYLLFKPGEVKAFVKSELFVFGSGILLFAFIQAAGKIIQNSICRYVTQMKNTKIYPERLNLTRRMIRQIAFVLFTTGIAIQIGLAFTT